MPGEPTRWTRHRSSPSRSSRSALAGVAGKWTWASFVIACRSASSTCPRARSPPWTWATARPDRCPAVAAANASTRSPTTSTTSELSRSNAAARPAVARPVCDARPSPVHGTVASTAHPSARMPSTVRPCVDDRCMPVATTWSRRAGWSRIAASVVRIRPNSARVPVTKQTVRRDIVPLTPPPACPTTAASPRRIAPAARRPTARVTSAAGMPVPGRCTVRSASPITCPGRRSRAATRLCRLTRRTSCSPGNTRFPGVPRSPSARRISRTYRANWAGSALAAWSGPSAVRSYVRCFSITVAPAATASAPASASVAWSEYPTGTPNRSASSPIQHRCASASATG